MISSICTKRKMQQTYTFHKHTKLHNSTDIMSCNQEITRFHAGNIWHSLTEQCYCRLIFIKCFYEKVFQEIKLLLLSLFLILIGVSIETFYSKLCGKLNLDCVIIFPFRYTCTAHFLFCSSEYSR